MSKPVPAPTRKLARAFYVLAHTRAETLWLANFTSENTRTTYRRAVSDFLLDMGIDCPEALYGVGQAHVIAWRETLKAKGLSNAAICNRLSALSSLFRYLTDQQLCAANPVSGVRYPGSSKTGIGSGKTPALTRRQVRLMLDAPLTHKGQRGISELQKLRDRALLHVFFYTGGRCSEPASLKVGSFRQDRGYWVLEFTTKGEKTNIVAIGEVDDQNAECVLALLDYLAISGHRYDPDAPLFMAVKGGRNTGAPMARASFYYLFKKYVALVGLPDRITPHSARATFITLAYEAGIQGEDIQRTVGHCSIQTTEGYNQSARKLRKSASLGVRY